MDHKGQMTFASDHSSTQLTITKWCHTMCVCV